MYNISGFLRILTTNNNLTDSFDNTEQYIKEIEDAGFLTAVFKENGLTIIISLMLFLLLVIILVSSSRKKKKTKGIKEEIMSYMYQPEPHQYTGTISVESNGISYARGNRKVVFDIAIEKETILAPFMVDVWFENRNYNYRESTLILSDISNFLKEGKYCKTVIITTDEEYEKMFSETDEDSNAEAE